MPDPTPARWADPFRLEPATAARLADALAALLLAPPPAYV
jgi:hypothetical protein